MVVTYFMMISVEGLLIALPTSTIHMKINKQQNDVSTYILQ